MHMQWPFSVCREKMLMQRVWREKLLHFSGGFSHPRRSGSAHVSMPCLISQTRNLVLTTIFLHQESLGTRTQTCTSLVVRVVDQGRAAAHQIHLQKPTLVAPGRVTGTRPPTTLTSPLHKLKSAPIILL
jgi:hypothetical protein